MSKKFEKYPIPSSWSWSTIGSLGIVASGGTPSTRERRYWGGDIPWVSPSDLTGYQGKFISSGKKFITQDGLDESSAKIIPKGSILYSSRAPIGYTVIAKNELSTNQGFKNLIPTKSLYPDYVYHYLNSAKQLAESMASGTTFLELSANKFSQIPIPVPPQKEQYKIVSKLEELLSELDKGIETLNHTQKQLTIFNQIILKLAFEGAITRVWRDENLENLDHEIIENIQKKRQLVYNEQIVKWKKELAEWKNSNKTKGRPTKPKLTKRLRVEKNEIDKLTDLPNKWKWNKLGNMAFVTKLAGFEFTKYVEYKEKGDIPVVKAQNVSKEGFLPRNFDYVDREVMEKLPRSRIYGGELLMVFVGAGLGNMGIVPEKNEYFLGPNVAKIELDKGLNNRFVKHYLSSLYGFSEISSHSKATAQGSISMGNIREVFIPVPSEREQAEIVKELDAQFSIIKNIQNTIKNSLKQSEILRQSIWKKAFSGSLVQQDEDDNSVLEMLTRIAQEKKTFLIEQKLKQKLSLKKKPMIRKNLSIIEVLQSSKEEKMSAKDVWKESVHKDDIEAFYSELKRVYNQIEEIEKGVLSLIK